MVINLTCSVKQILFIPVRWVQFYQAHHTNYPTYLLIEQIFLLGTTFSSHWTVSEFHPFKLASKKCV